MSRNAGVVYVGGSSGLGKLTLEGVGGEIECAEDGLAVGESRTA